MAVDERSSLTALSSEVKSMAATTKSKKKKQEAMQEQLVKDVLAIGFIGVAIYGSWLIYQAHREPIETLGWIGSFIYRSMDSMMGTGKWLLPVLLLLYGLSRLSPKVHFTKLQVIGIDLAALFILAFLHLGIIVGQEHPIQLGWTGLGGGIFGGVLAWLLYKAFGLVGAYITLALLAVIDLMVVSRGECMKWCQLAVLYLRRGLHHLKEGLKNFVFVEVVETETKPAAPKTPRRRKKDRKLAEAASEKPIIINNLQEIQEELAQNKQEQTADAKPLAEKKPETSETDASSGEDFKPVIAMEKEYKYPAVDLMEKAVNTQSGITPKEINDKVELLQKTLNDFGVKGQIAEVSVGPAITRYEFQPAPGVKVSKIVNLSDDIALSLAAAGVRIEAPIPGKAAVGIEVPNKTVSMVMMRDLLESSVFQEAQSKLTVALGKDIGGQTVVADLSKMPHLLIAGSTGSGKSVCMNALIISILYKAAPHEVKFLMVDPKMVELGNYNGIPHLISPVVTDPKKAASALRWAVHEMERRYELFAANGTKDIGRFNKLSAERLAKCATPEEREKIEVLPYIVVLIDELADLMMVAPADVEDAICRLAQMARAAGIHLVVATQRPSVDVITGIIKANIPSRIAFAVSSQIDSRTILDMGGAEKLLGKGDMLFYPTGLSKPIRVQGVYVSDKEIDRVVEDIKQQGEPVYDESIQTMALSEENESEESAPDKDGDDELLSEAAKLFIENGQASISLLQRRYRIGYTRAARIIDQMEQKGFVGPYEGSKPRQVKITMEDYCKIYES